MNDKVYQYFANKMNGIVSVSQRICTFGFTEELNEIVARFCKEFGLQYEKIDYIKRFTDKEIVLLFLARDLMIIRELAQFKEYKKFICVDVDLYQDHVKKNKLMNKKLWDYTANNAKNDIEAGGWVNSFTREPFSEAEMDEYVSNTEKKIGKYLSKEKKVLEIGCASGITMYSIAPKVGRYVAVDMSSISIRNNEKRINEKGIKNIKLYCLCANEIDTLSEQGFDIAIINSVLHCFPGFAYFHEVLKKIIPLMKNDGIIFLGDVMNKGQKEELVKTLVDYSVRNGSRTKVDLSQELFFEKEFFEHLPTAYPEIMRVLISKKEGVIQNELVNYRYDVTIQLDKKDAYTGKSFSTFCLGEN